MTTIAFDGYTVAADSQCTTGEFIAGHMNKIWPWDHGWFSVAGNTSHYLMVQTVLNGGKKPKKCKKFQAFVWDDRTKIAFEIYSDWTVAPAPCPTAYGSGADIAMAVLLKGGSAKKAVKFAAGVDINTGGPITKVTLRKKTDGRYTFNYTRQPLEPGI